MAARLVVSVLVFLLSVHGIAEDSKKAEIREIWAQDFEGIENLEGLEGFTWENQRASLVSRDDGGQCLELSTTAPSTFCSLYLRTPITVEPHLVLAFDHREETEGGIEGAYHGMSFFCNGKQGFWHSDTFSSTWRHVEVPITQLREQEQFGIRMEAGLVIDRIQLYGRTKDKKERGDNPAMMKVWFDNIRLFTDPAPRALEAAKPYTCHNNPPLLDWRGPTAPGTRLQYSQDSSFAQEKTVTVALDSPRPYYVPNLPLEPGTWYFRISPPNDTLDRWNPAQSVIIPRETHHYRVPAFNPADFRDQPRPRLLRRIRPEGTPITDDERTRVVKQAVRELEQGVPEHPGPYVEGDPRWPNWIDWYGGVADKVTSRVGSRLVNAARAAILTQDTTAVDASRQLLLAACDWDPKGGSAARHGDLQAASLLKGMVWCYDACESTLSPEEKERVHAILKERILQFYTKISPFRINPAQNHPWKKNTVVAESALVLLGVFPEAEEWLDVAIHNFCLRILPSMGFQGENQEGISYWSYGVNMLANFADLMLYMADLNLYDHPWLRQTCRFPIYLAPPNAYAISFADNSPRGNASYVGPAATELVGLLGERTHDPYALWYANTPQADTGFRAPADIPQSIFYPFIGYSLFHTCLSEGLESVDVGMRSGPYYAGHQHDDNNGFAIHAYGDKLAIDGGYYDWYGSPHFKAYSITTLAHNSLLVNGKCQKRATDGATTTFLDSPTFGFALGDAGFNPEIYEGKLSRFDRRLIFLKPGFVVVHDLVKSADTPVELDWLLHSHTDEAFPADSAAGTFSIVRPKSRLDGCFLAPAGINLRVEKSFDIGPQKPRESVFLPESDVQPEWTLYAHPEKAVTDTEFLAVMQIRRADETGAPAPVNSLENAQLRGCEIVVPYGRYVLVSRKQEALPGMIELGGLSTDGQCAAVLLNEKGTVESAFAIGATVVRFQGQELFKSDAPRNWAMDEGQKPEVLSADLTVDGKAVLMEGRRRRLPGGDISTWWATVKSSERRPCDLEIRDWTGKRPPRVRLGTRTLTGTELTLALSDADTCLAITGCGTFANAVLKPRRFTVAPATVIDDPGQPAPKDIVIDTDAPGPVHQSDLKGKVMEKVEALGGSAFCCIDGPIQWAEWEFSAVEAGMFELWVRGASEHEVIEREVSIDGIAVPAPDTSVRMQGTGGWCRQTNDWQWSRINAADGNAFRIELKPGTHTLRWEFVTGSQNVDQFRFRRVP